MALVVLATAANAQAVPALVRASPRGGALAVAFGKPDGGGTLWVAREGAAVARYDVPASHWILDAHVTGAGDVLLATTEVVPRAGPAVVTRYDRGPSDPAGIEVAGSEGLSDARFLEGSAGLALVTASGVFASDDGGRTFALLARWETDVYAFYAASGRVTADGGVEVLAPTFNTCGSSDTLEELTRLRAAPRGRAAATPVRLVHFPLAATLMADGGRLTLVSRGYSGPCSLRARSPSGDERALGQPTEECSLLAGTNRRFTVALAGGRVVRLAGLSSRLLGTLAGTDAPLDVVPDARGRALVLLDDGRVVRYSARAAPEVVLTVPR